MTGFPLNPNAFRRNGKYVAGRSKTATAVPEFGSNVTS